MTQENINELVKTIAESDDICQAILMIKDNEKEYKQSDFYKQTKIGLFDLIKAYKTLKPISGAILVQELQQTIDNLDWSKIQNLITAFVTDSQELIGDFAGKIEDLKTIL